MMKLRSTPPALLVALVAALSLGGCDHADDFDRSADAEEFADDEELADAEESSSTPLQAAGLDVVADSASSLAGVMYAWSYDGVVKLSDIGDGDIVMLKNYAQGYVRCDSSDEAHTNHSPSNIDSFVWKVHRTDLDGDGTDELQFELIDDTGETGTYLKMNNDDTVYCGTITGTGDAAAWNIGDSVAPSGTYYRTVLETLVNYKQDRCLTFDSNGGAGGSCTYYESRLFSMEILASAS